jgi:NAD(P)-dependent dehydrogenase (short-subunit alcohol dehydrogenase family)
MSLYKLLTLPLHRLRLPPPKSFDSQTVLITGANTGLGREAARQALELGASTVIMGVRTLSKGEAAKQDIIRKSPSTGVAIRPEAIEVWQLDMESFESVKSFASRAERYVKTGGGRLDVAIMNAGVATGKFVQTPEDGWERSLQVNCLSTALLSLRLLPLLQHSNSKSSSTSLPHLVIVASDIHAIASFPERTAPNILQALNDREQWEKGQTRNPAERYAVTKLLDHFIAIELANKVTSSIQDGAMPSVIVNSLTPGFCKSDLMSPSRGEKAPLPLRVMQWLVARDVTEGAKTYVDAAVQGVSSHGKWLENQVVTE